MVAAIDGRVVMGADQKHWSIKTALEQIKHCLFECEAGPLGNNIAWQWLEKAAQVGPQFWPGQGVWFEVEAQTATGRKLSQWEHFYIVGCSMSSDTERRLWLYDLSQDPPAPWHYGAVHYRGIVEGKLHLSRPKQDMAA